MYIYIVDIALVLANRFLSRYTRSISRWSCLQLKEFPTVNMLFYMPAQTKTCWVGNLGGKILHPVIIKRLNQNV